MPGIPALGGLKKNDGLHSLIFSRRRAGSMLGEKEEETGLWVAFRRTVNGDHLY